MDVFGKYFEAERYINEGLIRTTVPDTPNKPTRREWMLRFLDDLGHPEKAFPAIHLAGTSGKGSTAVMIAEILRAAGYMVGLHATPYLQVATEKLMFDGKYASAEEFIDLVEWIRPICEKWRGPEAPLHGMASFGITLEYFRRKKVDIAVIEAGVGGRDDLTNVLDTKLSVITPIGIDHTKTLGETIDSIAGHKAGIIKKGVPVVAWRSAGRHIIEETAKEKGSPLIWIDNNSGSLWPAQRPATTSLRRGDPRSHTHSWPPEKTLMQGEFQAINAAIARAAVRQIGSISTNEVETGISRARLPGRMERLQENPTVIVDGAHNYQKLKALFETISPSRKANNSGLVVIFGMLKSKANAEIVNILRALPGRLILTTPKVYEKEAADPYELAKALELDNIIIKPSFEDAVDMALKISNPADTVLITGSLYLAGHVRDRWYPRHDVLTQRTSWPRPDTS